MKLTPGQAKELKAKGFDIKTSGRMLPLFKPDFHYKTCKEVWECLEVTEDVEEIEIYYIGVKINKYEEKR